MKNKIFNLPEISFVGGETQNFQVALYDFKGEPFYAGDCTCDFSMVEYCNAHGSPIPLPNTRVTIVLYDGVYYAHVDLKNTDTKNLSGKFVYQFIIKDSVGETEIPGQGIIRIAKNIHSAYV